MYLSEMKKFFMLCVVLVARIDARFVSPFPMEYDQVVDACRMETGYTDELVAKEKASFYSENRGLRIFNYCFLEKTGLVTRDGKLNIDDTSTNLTSSLLNNIMRQCKTPEKQDPQSYFFKCFHWIVSVDMRLTEFANVIRSQVNNLTQIVNACVMETGYTDEVITEEEKSNLNKDAGLKKFNSCFLEKTGFGADEKFDIDDVLEKMSQSNVTHIIEFCESKITKKIIPDSVPFLSACLHLAVSTYARAITYDPISVLPETYYVTQIVNDCRMETGFTDEVLHKEEQSNFTEEEGLRKFNNCFLEKTGVITRDGKLNIDAALVKLPPGFAKPIIEHCQAKIILKYTTDSVHDFSTCYLHGVQNHILRVQKPFTQSVDFVVPGTTFAGNFYIF